MKKEDLQDRLVQVNKELEEHVKSHNEMVSQRDAAISEGLARHNMLIGQRNEINDWLAKLDQPEA